jgi:hypothetical protein
MTSASLIRSAAETKAECEAISIAISTVTTAPAIVKGRIRRYTCGDMRTHNAASAPIAKPSLRHHGTCHVLSVAAIRISGEQTTIASAKSASLRLLRFNTKNGQMK